MTCSLRALQQIPGNQLLSSNRSVSKWLTRQHGSAARPLDDRTATNAFLCAEQLKQCVRHACSEMAVAKARTPFSPSALSLRFRDLPARTQAQSTLSSQLSSRIPMTHNTKDRSSLQCSLHVSAQALSRPRLSLHVHLCMCLACSAPLRQFKAATPGVVARPESHSNAQASVHMTST